ncbi:CrcB family protein [Leucobacter chromiiresistens]
MTSHASLIELGLVVLGGAVGSLGRAAVSAALAAPTDGRGLPFATLLVNVTGAFALGLLVEVIAHRSDPARRRIRLLLGTGLLGGFTTYSLLAGELAESLLAGRYALAAVYAAATLLGGALASWLGLLAGRGIAQAGARDAQGAGPQGAGPHR